MKKQELIENVANNAKLGGLTERVDEFGSTEIGFYSNSKYYWFNLWDGKAFFSHSFSVNTGRTSHSFKAAYNVLKSIGYFNSNN
jgi:hypothetical protein